MSASATQSGHKKYVFFRERSSGPKSLGEKNQQTDVGVAGVAVGHATTYPSVNKQCSCVVCQFYAGGKISACYLVFILRTPLTTNDVLFASNGVS